MNRLTTDFFDAFGLGFEDLARRAKEGVTTYPPYNIVKMGDNSYMIEMALAGFTDEDIDITLEGKELFVKGDKKDTDGDAVYLHKGIANRPFTHRFTLASDVKVEDATFQNGVLNVRLNKYVPEEKKPRNIPINNRTKKSYLAE